MYPTPLGVSFVVQQRVSGTGQFTGVEYGRARVTLSKADPNAVVRAAARLYGTLANNLTLELVDRGVGNVISATRVEQVGSNIRVILRRGSSGSPLATSAEVAAALNSYDAYNSTPLGAVAGGDGTGLVVGASAVALTGGVNPSPLGALGFSWVVPANSHAGLFHFEQERPVLVRQLEFKFTIASGTHWVKVERGPLNEAFEFVSADAVPVVVYESLTTGAPDLTIADAPLLLPPRWGLRVTTDAALPGLVRMDVRRDD